MIGIIIFNIWLLGFVIGWLWLFNFEKLINNEYTEEQIKVNTQLSLFSWIMIFFVIINTIFRNKD